MPNEEEAYWGIFIISLEIYFEGLIPKGYLEALYGVSYFLSTNGCQALPGSFLKDSRNETTKGINGLTHASHTPRPGVVTLGGAGCPDPGEDSDNEDQKNQSTNQPQPLDESAPIFVWVTKFFDTTWSVLVSRIETGIPGWPSV